MAPIPIPDNSGAQAAEALAEITGLTVLSVRRTSASPARAIPVSPTVEWQITVHGNVKGRVIDEEDTIRRMLLLGIGVYRTAEHPDGYWWYGHSRDEKNIVVSTKMVNDPVTWADRVRAMPANGVCPMGAEVVAACRVWVDTPSWRIPPEYQWLREAASAYLTRLAAAKIPPATVGTELWINGALAVRRYEDGWRYCREGELPRQLADERELVRHPYDVRVP